MAAVSSVSEPDPVDSTGLCLLSLDGGGVRGLSALFILKRLMDQLNGTREAADLPVVKPCDIFDLIGGTSTGGLIAIMLGRLEMDVDECIDQYNKIIKDIFAEKKSRLPINLAGKVKARFDSEKLKTSIEEVLKPKGGTLDDKFNNGKARGCRTFVCAVAKETTSVTRLRSYSLPDENSISATVCQVALATSAATSFFDEVSIGQRKFVDGALGANNPVDEVEGEAANIWCSESGDLKSVVKCFVSIGTGNPGKQAIEDNVLKFFSNTLVKMKTETEETERKFIARWRKAFDEKRYFRLNVDQGLQGIGLEEYKAQGSIEAATDEFLRHQAQKSRMRDCVSNLKQKKSKTDTNFAAIVNEYIVQKIKKSIDTHEICWIVPFERNPRFVGRSLELERLESTLFAKDHVSKMAICGLGGVGKSHIMLEFAYLMQETRPEYSVFWIAATNVEKLRQDFFKLGQALRLPRIEEQQVNAQQLVEEYLSQDRVGSWLLILDNVDDMDIWINNLKNCLPRSRNGRIALATRNRKVAVKFAQSNVVEVPEMDEEVATQLLQKSLMDGELLNNYPETKELLEKLTFLPLAIVQAAAYMNENGCTLSDYKALLAEQEGNVIEILSEDFEDDGRYQETQNPVATTWLISFEQIRRLSPTAAEYLSFMSCVDSKDIPRSLLPPTQSLKSETEAIGTLNAYAFCSRNVANTALNIHRLVHIAMRNWLRRENQLSPWNRKAISRLRELLSDAEPGNRSVWRPYLPHATYILKPDNAENMARNTVGLRWHFVNILYSEGRYNETERALEDLLTIEKEAMGPENSSTLQTMNLLAMTYMSQGNWKKAENLLIDVISTRKRVLGVEHKDTMSSMNNLASLYAHQGQREKSEELHLKVMEARERLSGEESEDTATSIANLAQVYSQQGQLEKCEILEKRALEIREKVLGPEHPNTLNSMNSLASTYAQQQKLIQAGELLEKAKEICQRVLGSRHPLTLANKSHLASYYRRRGDRKAAEENHLQVLELRKELLGEEHRETLSSMNNLATIYSDQNRWEEAGELHEKVRKIRTEKEGPDHPETLTSMDNLAAVYSHQKRWAEVIRLTFYVVEARKRTFGIEHRDTRDSMTTLARAYYGQGSLQKAQELQHQLVKIGKEILEDGDSQTLSYISDLVATYKQQGRLKQAEQSITELLEIKKRVLGTDHESIWQTSSDLASLYNDQGRWKEAEKLHIQAMKIQEQKFGVEHLNTLKTMSALASIYRHQERLEEAEKLQIQVLKANEKIFGHEHQNTLTIMNNLAMTYSEQDRHDEAEKLQLEIIAIHKRVLGTENLKTLTSIGGLATTYHREGRLKDSEKLLVEVMGLQKKALEEDDPDLLITQGNLAMNYYQQGQYQKAEELGREVVMKRERKLGAIHPNTLISKANLALAYQAERQWEEAEKLQCQILEARKEVLGLKHPDTLSTIGDLAFSRRCLSQIEDSINLMTECYDLRMEVLGPQDFRTVAASNAIIRWKADRDNGRM